MKFDHDEFTEIAFIFEKENGRNHSEFEKKIIEESKFKDIPTDQLEMGIVNGIQDKIYKSEAERVSAYWTLSKRGNKKLILRFKNWLKTELEDENPIAIFQILVALDLLGESSFSEERIQLDSNETELNIRDAINYLN